MQGCVISCRTIVFFRKSRNLSRSLLTNNNFYCAVDIICQLRFSTFTQDFEYGKINFQERLCVWVKECYQVTAEIIPIILRLRDFHRFITVPCLNRATLYQAESMIYFLLWKLKVDWSGNAVFPSLGSKTHFLLIVLLIMSEHD